MYSEVHSIEINKWKFTPSIYTTYKLYSSTYWDNKMWGFIISDLFSQVKRHNSFWKKLFFL